MKNLLVAATLIIALSTVASAQNCRPIFHPPSVFLRPAGGVVVETRAARHGSTTPKVHLCLDSR
jgi:hypothetical protein